NAQSGQQTGKNYIGTLVGYDRANFSRASAECTAADAYKKMLPVRLNMPCLEVCPSNRLEHVGGIGRQGFPFEQLRCTPDAGYVVERVKAISDDELHRDVFS